jgi:anti-sigma factor RsiW
MDPQLTELRSHDEAEELLPWYATGQLDATDRMRVEAHLADCVECRRQLTVERQLMHEFRAMTPEIESGWNRLRARIVRPGPAPLRRRGLAEFWQLLTRPAVAGLAVAQLAFVILAGGFLISLSKPNYHALNSPPPTAAANMIVMFQPNATEKDMRAALESAGASIVGGPTPANAYLLHVAPSGRAAAVARLHDSNAVQLAEPIDSAGG